MKVIELNEAQFSLVSTAKTRELIDLLSKANENKMTYSKIDEKLETGTSTYLSRLSGLEQRSPFYGEEEKAPITRLKKGLWGLRFENVEYVTKDKILSLKIGYGKGMFEERRVLRSEIVVYFKKLMTEVSEGGIIRMFRGDGSSALESRDIIINTISDKHVRIQMLYAYENPKIEEAKKIGIEVKALPKSETWVKDSLRATIADYRCAHIISKTARPGAIQLKDMHGDDYSNEYGIIETRYPIVVGILCQLFDHIWQSS